MSPKQSSYQILIGNDIHKSNISLGEQAPDGKVEQNSDGTLSRHTSPEPTRETAAAHDQAPHVGPDSAMGKRRKSKQQQQQQQFQQKLTKSFEQRHASESKGPVYPGAGQQKESPSVIEKCKISIEVERSKDHTSSMAFIEAQQSGRTVNLEPSNNPHKADECTDDVSPSTTRVIRQSINDEPSYQTGSPGCPTSNSTWSTLGHPSAQDSAIRQQDSIRERCTPDKAPKRQK